MSEHNCYLCGCTDHYSRPGRVRDDSTLKILECKNCGLVFLSKNELPPDFYENSGMHGGDCPPTDVLMRETDRDDERRFQYLSEKITNRDLLDFGCGAAGFLLKAQKKARSVIGIELEARLHKHYESHNLKVFQNLGHLPAHQRFDLITAFHVIEHLQDPAGMLKDLASKLRGKGSSLIIEVPSSADALLTLYESCSFAEFTYWSCHLYLFNANTLSDLTKKAGLKLDYVRHIQRYPLSNHLYWLAKGLPGGHQVWSFLDDTELTRLYEAQLAALGLSDTLIAGLSL